jgi:hypothetical protein
MMLVNPEHIPWRLSVPEFTQALTAQWTDVQFGEWTDGLGTTHLQWTIELAEGRLSGLPADTFFVYFLNNYALSFGGYYEDVFEFGVWFRQYVPEEYPLLLCDTAWCNKTLIYPGMTYSELEDIAFLNPLGTMSEEDFLAFMQHSAESNWAAVREVLYRNVDPLFYERDREFREAAEERLEERICQVLETAGVADELLKENPLTG